MDNTPIPSHPSFSSPADGTVFISYARADDVKPAPPKKSMGWVSFFWNNLKCELIYLGAKQAELWLDRYQIDPSEAFTAKIDAAIKEAKVIIPIFSVNWANSEWCRREVDGFDEAHEDAPSRIVPVFKYPPPADDKLPRIMLGEHAREGFRFFEREANDDIKEFYYRGLKDEDAYFSILRKLALSVIERLGRASVNTDEKNRNSGMDSQSPNDGDVNTPLPSVDSVFHHSQPGIQAGIDTAESGVSVERSVLPQSSIGKTVFLAFSAQELGDARQRLKNDLKKMGATVVPAIENPPESATEFESVIREALAQAEFAVHFLGEKRGFTPEGGFEPMLDMQLRLVREIASTKKLTRILWMPRCLPGKIEAERDPMAVADKFGGFQAGEEVFGKGVTDLSQWLRERLEPRPEPVIASKPNRLVVVASAQSADDKFAVALARLAQGAGPRMKPLLFDSAWSDTEIDLVVLIPWGNANSVEIDALLDKLPETAHIICLILPGGDEAAKSLFFKDGLFVENIAALPTNRQEAKEFLEQLEIIQPKGVGQ